jgi:hypothetical protein
LIRTIAFVARPNSLGAWDTFVAIHAPIPVGPEGRTLTVSAVLSRDGEKIRTFAKELTLAAPETGSQFQPITLFGDGSTKPGHYKLNVALSAPGEKRVVGSSVAFDVPEVPTDQLILSGPLLARVEEHGLAVSSDGAEPVLLRQVIGDGSSFEPLTVHEIDPNDTLLAYWEACRYRNKPDLTGARISRRIVDAEGNVIHELGTDALKLQGGKIQCHNALERVDPGTLAPGEYSVELVVQQADKVIAREVVPLLVD